MGMNEKNSYDEFTLSFKVGEDVPIDQYEMTMFNYEFAGNRTECNVVAVDGVRVLQYKIPATLPLEQFFTKQLYKGEFLSILSNVLSQLMYFEENNLSYKKLLLDTKYMYIELSDLSVQLIYLPINKKHSDANISVFIQDFIGKVRFANMECVKCVGDILAYLDSKMLFNLGEFYSYIISLEKEELDSDNTSYEGETTVLATSTNYKNPIPYLVRIKTNELIPITKSPFMVGKSPDADYQITDNRRVSRTHATFRVSNGECYVKDNSSTNHTFINSVLIQPEFEIMLSNDDYIRLGDEEFKYWVR